MEGMEQQTGYLTVMAIAFVLLIIIVGGIILLSHAIVKRGSLPASHNGSVNAPTSGAPNATSPNASSEYSEVEVGAELNNSISAGFNVNLATFSAMNVSQCQLEQISYCNNNEPGQFVCINSNFASGFEAQRNAAFADKSRACPLFILARNIGCAVANDYCVVTDTYPGAVGVSNSNNST